ncbi:hypothetical protein CJP72_07885 [Citrobacter sp. NCU1]|nr:hypothetical protein [Citrobacter sp. NCU1]
MNNAIHTLFPLLSVIIQAADALAFELLVSSMRLALMGRRSATFKSVPDRFVTHPSHLLM